MNTNKKYCAAPWRGLHLNFNGHVKTCCAATTEIENVIKSPELQKIKASIKQGTLHKEYCRGCIEREDKGLQSERSWHNSVSPNLDYHTLDTNEHFPALIDIRWTNLCNLACVYCSSYFSSKWASLEGKPVSTNINARYQEVIDYIDRHRHHVKEVALVGGEPLLMKENNKLLDILPDEILVTVITNMVTDFDKFPVPKKLLARERVGWSMSFDNVGEHFEYVRWGSTWDQLDKNVTTVAKKINDSQHHGGIHSVYNLYNCTRLCELKNYAVAKDLTIMWQKVSGDHLDPSLHNDRIRSLALKEIQIYRESFEISELDKVFLAGIETNLQQGIEQQSRVFQQHTHDIENKWHPDKKGQFAKLWPELAEAL